MKTGGLDGCGRVKKSPAPTGGGLARDVGNCFPTRTNLPAKWMLDFDLGRVLINRLARSGRSRSSILQHIPYVRGSRRISKYRRLHIFRCEPVTDRKAE